MPRITHITPDFAVAAALSEKDFAKLAAMGFKSVLSNLPDGELQAHPTSGQASFLARQAGLDYRHVPLAKLDIFSERTVESVGRALSELPGPVLAHCASGLRSAIAWAAVAVRSEPADAVLARLRSAGLELDMIREQLDAQSGADGGHASRAREAACGASA
jgi:sulfide:quinone oxidoreductase